MSSRYLPSGFSSIQLSVLGKMSFKEFQDGRHLGYRNGTNLAILNLHVAPIPPIKYQLNPTFCSGDVLRISRWPPSLDIQTERIEQFWISMSLRYLPSSFSSIWLSVREMSLKEFQDDYPFGYRDGTDLAVLNLHVARYLPPSFSPIWLSIREEMSFKEFQEGGHLRHRNATILAILNLHVAQMPPTKYPFNPTYGFGGDVENVKNKQRTMDGWTTDNVLQLKMLRAMNVKFWENKH